MSLGAIAGAERIILIIMVEMEGAIILMGETEEVSRMPLIP
jgi:hypothetical protein